MKSGKTITFARWIDRLRDARARARILVRIERLAAGHRGDAKAIDRGVWVLRVDHCPGYRVYYTRRGSELVILLCGGDKRTQRRDIQKAIELASNL